MRYDGKLDVYNLRVTAALKTFAEGGGVVVITPFTTYTDEDGIFRGDGFAANLQVLTDGLVRTNRWLGPVGGGGKDGPQVVWTGGRDERDFASGS